MIGRRSGVRPDGLVPRASFAALLVASALAWGSAPAVAGFEPEIAATAFGIRDVFVRCRNVTTGQQVAGPAGSPISRCADLGLQADFGDRIEIRLRGIVPASGDPFVPPLFIYHPISDLNHFGIAVGDLDADGDQDIVQAHAWLLWENGGGRRPEFTQHTLDDIRADLSVELVDLDENGTLDILAPGPPASESLRWFRNLGGSPPAFDTVLVESRDNFVFHDPFGAEIDGDGELDIVARLELTSPFAYEELDWLERDGESFTAHAIHDAAFIGGAAAFDFDQDGDGDVVLTDLELPSSNSLLLFVNDGNEPPGWDEHLLESDQYGHHIMTADFDLDGDLDFAVGPNIVNDDRLVIYENVGPSEPFFVGHLVGISDGASYAAAGDVDGDGLPDVVSARQVSESGETAWFRNLGTQPPSFGEYPISIERRMLRVQVGDLDGDSDLDLVGDSVFDDDLYWFEQRRVFGAAVGGLESIRVTCRNERTGALVRRNLEGRFSWDCQAMGLEVEPGDEVTTIVTGAAD